jgi:anti-sigma factor RsiW
MNTGFDRHFAYEDWEDYALGAMPDQQVEALEEHLLICPACQNLLAEADEYVEIAKAALAIHAHGKNSETALVTDRRTRRRLSKAVGAAATRI